MVDFQIDFGSTRTSVAVQLNGLEQTGEMIRACALEPRGDQVVVVTDKLVGEIYGPTVARSLDQSGFRTLECRFGQGEAYKTLAATGEVYQFFADKAVGRDAFVLALGGGVVSDLAGFVAATWMRGVRFIVCPTTLESDVDACIGGKTAINIPGAKNLVGAFHQPILVLVDPACLETLSDRDVRAGLAESVKHAVIRSPEFLGWHEANAGEFLARSHTHLKELILQSLRIKAEIVEQDAREEKGLRELLNLGHTIGHAIEECCGFALRHGECVALGMLAECRISRAVGLLDDDVTPRVFTLLDRLGLPTKLRDPIPTDRIMEAIRRDKKVRGGVARLVLLEGLARPTVRDDVPEAQVRSAFESLLPQRSASSWKKT